MANNHRSDEINIAKALPWVFLVFLIVFAFFLWPDAGEKREAKNASTESSETVVAEDGSVENEIKERAEILDLINFRSEPNEANSTIIGTVNKGESHRIVNKQKKWLKIEKEDGSSGYITTDPKYVKIVSE